MSPSTCTLQVAVLALLYAKGFGGRTVIIPEAASAIEHAPFRLDCFYKDTIIVTQSVCRWSVAGNGTTTLIGIFYDDCLFVNVFEEIYSFECANKTATSMIIKSADRKLHGTVFSCSFFVNSVSTNDTVTILISVPVSSIKLTKPEMDIITTTENGTVSFICNASAAYPKPRIVWFSDSHTPLDYRDDIAITNTVTAISDSDGYLYTVMSNMTLYPTKYDNGSHIYCNASNTEEHIISSKRKALLNVQYPPSSPIFFMRSNVSVKNVTIIINKSLTIRCKSNGNPFPNYKWTNTQKEVVSGEELYIENIKKADDGTYSCMAYNTFTTEGEPGYHNTSASIEVTVLFPPDSPKLFYLKPGITEQIANSTLKVVKGDNISVHCNSTGKPRPVSVWNGPKSSDLLLIRSIEADVNSTCTSSNVMIETAGVTKNGLESRDLTIIALYPPRNPVIYIQLQSDSTREALNFTGILEGSDFSLYCIAVSNPSPSYKWTGPVKSNHMSTSEELFVNNIQRNQSGPFICYAQNEMERSFGNTETGRNNQSIYFDILYQAVIKYFGAADFQINKNMMTVDQGEDMRVICKAECNPFANNTIFFKGRIVNETIRSDTIFYNLINTSCSDAGRYICKGKNEYNYKTDASKELFVYVKCPPQPSVDQPPEKNISAALTGSALFRFHAAPYYDPGITHFRWFKQGNGSKYFLRNGTKTSISSSDIHTFLRIDDVSEVDYGMYILEYNNSFGTNKFTFYLQRKDQTISEDNHQSNDKNYLPIVIGIVTSVLVIVGITLGIVIYIKRYQKKADNGNRSYDNICGMHAKSSENTSVSSPVYEGLKPTDERGYLEMKEQAYDILTPTKDSVETNDPVYTNLKL